MKTSSPSSDRNLLFGILSLQMDFIDREQLIAAMNAWVLDKAQPLEEILVRQGALGEEEKSLLQALVAKHLEMHDNSPERSLAQVSSVAASVRDQLRGIQDEDVGASLIHVTKTRGEDSQLAQTLSLGHSTSEGQRFRVLRPHAKGGLGEVFVASDNELPREVALKQIRERQADNPESRARFMLEAELTGGLEHPGIVPVYGLGQYADGRPFYAMRFIRGDSLKEAIAQFYEGDKAGLTASERSLSLRRLLGRFIDVCDAVEYAHSRGVLHRDLKPGNVMLGKYGETLVVDWGLAKAVGSGPDHELVDEPMLAPSSGTGSAPTQMGSAIGTPAYMSPEQAAGRLDLLGTASDVYSLGATLYSLLTGQRPFQDHDTATVLRKVQKGDFPAPREVAAHVPAALEAVCLKAMALAPENRYASPRSLAEDIEHWLADEPVSAYRDPLLSRAARWARRHKVSVATVAVLLLTALVSLSIGAVLLTRANQRIRAAQRVAEKNEQIARENFRLARKAVDDYLTTVSQETLLDEPGMQPLRRKLLSQALDYYRVFVQRRADDPQLRLELRDANLLLGTITQKIGSHQESMAAFQRALDINQQLVEQDPTDEALQFKLARCEYAIATALDDAGQTKDALASFDRAVRLLTRLAEQQPEDVLVLSQLRAAYNAIGGLKRHQGDLEEARSLYRRALEIGGPLAEGDDAEGEHRNGQAQGLYSLALLCREIGDQEQAIDHYQASVAIREQLVDEFPRKQIFQSKLTLSYSGLANTLADLGRFREAIEQHRAAVQIRERLVRENPAVTEYHDLLAGSYSNLASEYRQIGELEKSSDLGLKATAIWRRLSEQHPEIVDYRVSLGTSFYNLGNLHLGNPAADASSMDDETKKSKIGQSVQHYLSSIEVYESLLAQFPDIPEYQAALANSYNNCGSAYHLLDEKDKSREMSRKALALREQLVADNPQVPDYRNQLASAYSNAAGDESDPAKMFELLNKAVDLRQSLVDEFPDVPNYRYKLAFSLQIVALRQFLGGQQAESMPTFRRIIPLMEELHAEFPNVPNYRRMLVQALQLYAAGQRLSDDWKQAAETERKIATIFEQLLAKEPQNLEFILGLSGGIEGVGKCFHKGEDFAQALDNYARAIQVLEPVIDQEPRNQQLGAALRGVLEYRVDIFETLGRHQEAIVDLSRIVELSPNPLSSRLKRARLRALTGQYGEGTGEAAELLNGQTDLGKVDFYNAACVFSLAVATARADDKLSENRRKSLAAEYVETAVDCLRRARMSGYFGTEEEIEHLSKDTDFDALRAERAFVDFQNSLRIDGGGNSDVPDP